MKQLIVVLLSLFAISCAHRSSEPLDQNDALQAAHAFLTAYLQIDFEQILPLCAADAPLKSDMEQNARSLNASLPELQKRLRDDLKRYTFEIGAVKINPSRDSAFVSYSLFTPELPDGLPCRLTLVKEEYAWRVSKLL